MGACNLVLFIRVLDCIFCFVGVGFFFGGREVIELSDKFFGFALSLSLKA